MMHQQQPSHLRCNHNNAGGACSSRALALQHQPFSSQTHSLSQITASGAGWLVGWLCSASQRAWQHRALCAADLAAQVQEILNRPQLLALLCHVNGVIHQVTVWQRLVMTVVVRGGRRGGQQGAPQCRATPKILNLAEIQHLQGATAVCLAFAIAIANGCVMQASQKQPPYRAASRCCAM